MNAVDPIDKGTQGKRSLIAKFAARFGVEPEKMMSTLKATAFKVQDGEATNEQMMALLVVADQYGLNPWTKEIYAFPDNKGIVPVVGVDGWARIINSHPEFDGMDFEADAEACTCRIYRKDRAHPIAVTEYMAECKRATKPWSTHPRRMLRHKAMIQAARIAFGFAGIYDQDEAERIVERDMGEAEVVVESSRPTLEAYPQDKFDENFPSWKRLIESGRKTAEDIIAMVSTKATLSEDQQQTIHAIRQPIEGEVVAQEEVA